MKPLVRKQSSYQRTYKKTRRSSAQSVRIARLFGAAVGQMPFVTQPGTLRPVRQFATDTIKVRALINKPRTSLRAQQGQPVFYNNQLIYFNSNSYLAEPERLWLLESLLGSKALQQALSSNGIINDYFIETLFEAVPFSFYTGVNETYLLGYNDELTQADFGPLTKIRALTALQRFGVAALEQAK